MLKTKTPDIINTISEEIATDNCNKSARILEKYEGMTVEQKGIVDDLLLDICGWTLKTLTVLAKERENYVEVDDA